MKNPNLQFGPKSTALIDWLHPFGLVSKDAKEDVVCAPLVGWGRPLAHWWNFDPRSSLTRVDLDSRNTVQEAGSSVCDFFLI